MESTWYGIVAGDVGTDLLQCAVCTVEYYAEFDNCYQSRDTRLSNKIVLCVIHDISYLMTLCQSHDGNHSVLHDM